MWPPDSYHRWREDLALLNDLGVDAYRFSIAVPRIISTPDGVPNEKGLDFYEGVVDALLEAGIKPVVTLYHWDLPQYLGDEGGWLNRRTAYALADYAGIVAKAPRRPRRHLDHAERAVVFVLPELRSQGARAGPGPRSRRLPGGPPPESGAWSDDAGRPRRSGGQGEVFGHVESAVQPWRRRRLPSPRPDLQPRFLDPMLRGRYPDELFSITKGICDWDFIQSGDLELIHQPIDVLGINYYSTNRVAMSDRPQFPQSTEASTAPGASDVDWLPTEGPHTDMGWNIDPDGLHDLLVRVHDNYPEVDLVVTENGMACRDQLTVNEDGTKSVHDPDRIDYLKRHFAAAKRAIDDGRAADRLFRVVAA